MRSFEDVAADVQDALSKNNAASLLSYADELRAVATPESEAMGRNARGVAALLDGNYQQALEQFLTAIDIYTKVGNRAGVAQVASSIGNVYANTGNYPQALEHFRRALDIYREMNNRNGVAGITGNIGNVYMSTGEYPQALEHLQSAADIHAALGDRVGVARVTGNIGNVYNDTGDFPLALEHYRRSLKMNEDSGDRAEVAHVTGNIGNIFNLTGDYTQALEHYRRAVDIYSEIGDRVGVTFVTSNILYTLLSDLAFDEARSVLKTLDEIVIADPQVVITREVSRAMLQSIDGHEETSQHTLRGALDIAIAHSLRSKQADVCRELRDMAQKRNDFAAYIEHNNEYTRINEEIRGADAKLKIAMHTMERDIAAKDKETARHMAVLHSTLPKHIADRVAMGEVVNDHIEYASVLFLDIVGFTAISSTIPAGHVVHLLDSIFSECDVICERHNITKIKTIGDSYMAVSGLQEHSASPVADIAVAALDMMLALATLHVSMPPELGDTSWTKDVGDINVRIGIHCGPVVAGVLGRGRLQYDVWGDTVNIASRMESTSEPGRIHISDVFAVELAHSMNPSYTVLPRGSIEIKGKGEMTTFWLERA
ncbi:hypothetical protein BH10BAC6_BH10BAC6_05830 [soil metagenome]